MDPDSVGLPEVREPTQRDKVAAMTIDGWTPTEIAAYLNCGKRTVMFHLEQIAGSAPVPVKRLPAAVSVLEVA